MITYSAWLGTLQTLAWRPQPPSADTANFAMAGLPLVLSPCVWCPSPSYVCPDAPGSLAEETERRAGRGDLPADCPKAPALLSHLALWVSLSCPVKIGGNSCAFPTQDLFQVMSGPRLQNSLCYFSNS